MTTPRDASQDRTEDVDYGSYLALGELLALQRPRSRPEHPDELLFIVVHQASELWFKEILHELDALIDVLERGEAEFALFRMGRINALMRIVSAQLSALECLDDLAHEKGRPGTGRGILAEPPAARRPVDRDDLADEILAMHGPEHTRIARVAAVVAPHDEASRPAACYAMDENGPSRRAAAISRHVVGDDVSPFWLYRPGESDHEDAIAGAKRR